jgi:hypothetical protein
LQVIWDFLYFPLWWYSAGLVKTIRGVGRFYRTAATDLGFWVWLKNIFVPMYGQYDIAGRLISFIIRLVQVILRGLALALIVLLGLVFLIFYILLPFLILAAIGRQVF